MISTWYLFIVLVVFLVFAGGFILIATTMFSEICSTRSGWARHKADLSNLEDDPVISPLSIEGLTGELYVKASTKYSDYHNKLSRAHQNEKHFRSLFWNEVWQMLLVVVFGIASAAMVYYSIVYLDGRFAPLFQAIKAL